MNRTIRKDDITIGEHIISGLEDVLANQSVKITTTSELVRHLDTIFNATEQEPTD